MLKSITLLVCGFHGFGIYVLNFVVFVLVHLAQIVTNAD
jgi:hypothetical protein